MGVGSSESIAEALKKAYARDTFFDGDLQWEPPTSSATAIHMLREQALARQRPEVPVLAAIPAVGLAWIIERRRRVGGL
jgi:hypothetical protein